MRRGTVVKSTAIRAVYIGFFGETGSNLAQVVPFPRSFLGLMTIATKKRASAMKSKSGRMKSIRVDVG